MIILDATTKSLQVKLSGTVATSQLPFVASYIDSTGTATTPGEQDGASNNTTAVNVVSAPAASTQRLVKNISIQNADSAAATVTVIYNNNSTLRNIFVATLGVGDQLIYEDGEGWSCIDSSGNLKTSGGGGTVSSAIAPQGRLTLTSATPVMNADATAQTTIYYYPYVGRMVPVYDGSKMNNSDIGASGLSLALNATNHLNAKLYDVFVFVNSGTLTLGAGPAWTNATTRSALLSQVNGFWVNSSTITLTNGATSYSSIGANQATYLGTFYCTANGQTGMMFKPTPASGGTANILGLYNGYNRVPVRSLCADSKSSWTYNSSTWRAADNSSSNSISFVDGLQTEFLKSTYQTVMSMAGGGSGNIGINLDSTTATPGAILMTSSTTVNATMLSQGVFYPQLGLHYVQAMESSSSTATFFANGYCAWST